MQTSINYNSQNFKALNYSKVYGDGLKHVKKELPQLEKLGEKYDIKLSSSFDPLVDENLINVYVSKLNSKYNFIRELFSYRGHGCFRSNCHSESLLDVVNRAIKTLE